MARLLVFFPQAALALMFLPPLAAGTFKDADIQKLGQSILVAVDGPQFTDADRRFVIKHLTAVKRPGLDDLYKDALYSLGRLGLSTEKLPSTPESQKSEYNNSINRKPEEPPSPTSLVPKQLETSGEREAEEKPVDCIPATAENDNSCTTTPFGKVWSLIRQRKELSNRDWEKEISWTIRNLQSEPLTMDVLHLQLHCIALLADVNPKEALAALRAVYTNHYQIWNAGLLFALSTMPDSNIIVGNRISIEGLDKLLRARFQEVDIGFAKLVRDNANAVEDVIDEISDPRFQLVLKLRLFESLTGSPLPNL